MLSKHHAGLAASTSVWSVVPCFCGDMLSLCLDRFDIPLDWTPSSPTFNMPFTGPELATKVHVREECVYTLPLLIATAQVADTCTQSVSIAAASSTKLCARLSPVYICSTWLDRNSTRKLACKHGLLVGILYKDLKSTSLSIATGCMTKLSMTN